MCADVQSNLYNENMSGLLLDQLGMLVYVECKEVFRGVQRCREVYKGIYRGV